MQSGYIFHKQNGDISLLKLGKDSPDSLRVLVVEFGGIPP